MTATLTPPVSAPPAYHDQGGMTYPTGGDHMPSDLSIPLNMNEVPTDFFCKLILSNVLAGSLIGKSGSTISNVRAKSGASIRISNVANQYSPERLALFSGSRDQITIALQQVVELGAASAAIDQVMAMNENPIQIKVVIPKSSVSILIGKGGLRINEMREKTGVKIHVSTKEEHPVPPAERYVKIGGTEASAVCDALVMVLTAIQGDPMVRECHSFGPELAPVTHSSPLGHYGAMGAFPPANVPSPLGMPQMSPYPAGQSMVQANGFHMGGMPMDYSRAYQMESWMLERNCEIFMQVPDQYVGILVGKNGQHISDIKNQSGAKIEISKKGDYVEGTQDRLVTINGPISAVHAAHARMMRRILELNQQETRNTFRDNAEPAMVDPYYPGHY